jgi:hypothetical protein
VLLLGVVGFLVFLVGFLGEGRGFFVGAVLGFVGLCFLFVFSF